MISFDRRWAMPNSATFDIKPIRELLEREVSDGVWIDPFARNSKIASVTNDLDPKTDADYHLDAYDFLCRFDDESVDGVLFDPPYSPRQISECYNGIGLKVGIEDTQASFWSKCKKQIARIVKRGGKVLCFGWNSGGIGKSNGFELIHILLVPHGGWHNDTIVTVEVKE